MKKALVLSGGAFRGAVQIPVIEYLCSDNEYDIILGTSVGAVNGVLAAQNELELLRKIWEEVDGLGGFLKLKWHWPFNGIYSMKPLRYKLEKYVSLNKLKTDFVAGVVSFTDGEYYSLDSRDMPTDKHLWDAIQASSCMAGIMEPSELLIEDYQHLGCDGGYRNIFPVPLMKDYDHIDVVSCTPLNRMDMKSHGAHKKDIISLLVRGLEIFEDEIFDKDLLELKLSAKSVTVYAPQGDPLSSLDASRETIKHRFRLGEEAINNPIFL
jgi:predicted acylesterase/phospholipase RssA